MSKHSSKVLRVILVVGLLTPTPSFAQPIPPVVTEESEVQILDEAEKKSAEVAPQAESPQEPAKSAPKKTGLSGLLQRIFGGGSNSSESAKSANTQQQAQDAEREGAEKPETDESQAGIPDALSPEGDTGEAPENYLPEEYKTAVRNWEPPNYAGQESALGWSPQAFAIPEGLRARVDFWISIYSKYTTEMGVMHDTAHLEIVYAPVDFRPIMKNDGWTAREKARERERLVKSKRAEIEDRLRRLEAVTDPQTLTGEDLRIWKLFENVDEPNKFRAALGKGRVRFQLGQKDRFFVGIYYSGRYMHQMEKIFREQGLPIEITRLPFVESSFNIYARSKVGASGVWQFMRRTARPLMMVNPAVDERNDPIEATRASAKMLRSNYQLLNSWPLAITGYNHGPSGVARIVKKTGLNDLSKIVGSYSSRSFGFASENFYACFLAALEVERNAKMYFGDVKWSTEFESVEIPVTQSIPYKAVLSWYDGNEDLAKLHNFHIQPVVRKGRSHIPRGTFVRVPLALKDMAVGYMQGSIKAADVPRVARDESRVMAKKTSVALTEAKRYKVRRGDNLTGIAREFGVTIPELRRANNLRRDNVRYGQILVIPD